MAKPLPGGEAVIIDTTGAVIGSTAGSKALLGAVDIKLADRPGGSVVQQGDTMIGVQPIIDRKGQRIGTAILAMTPRTLIDIWSGILIYSSLILFLALAVCAFFLIPLAKRALKPVTDLERGIRGRDAKDKSKLADSSDDRLLKPLLTAIDEVHERSEAAMRRALTMAYTDPVTRLPNRLRFVSKLDGTVAAGQELFFVICDLDRFRQVNVTYGPRVADLVLATVAERLRATASLSQAGAFFLGRIGADQFGIILPVSEQSAVSEFLMAAERRFRNHDT